MFNELSEAFFLRLAVNLFSVIILIALVYHPVYKKKDFFFTLFLFNATIFIVTYLLNQVELSIGAAFGLFAVFSLLRYRTEDISAKDMTYLFLVIAIGLITAVNKAGIAESIFINVFLLALAYVLESNLIMKNENTQKILYDKMDLIKPEARELLIADLKERTGLNIHKIDLTKMDLTKNIVNITVYYYE